MDFKAIAQELGKKDERREKVISDNREILRLSKKMISLIHKDDLEAAKRQNAACLKKIAEARKNIDPDNKGILDAALSEYVEAVCFLKYALGEEIPTAHELNVDIEPYLMGLCDLTGELGRRAVYQTSSGNFSDVIKIRDFITTIYDGFLEFTLRNGELRKKFDSIKWNLKKIEEIIFELKIRDKI